MKRHICVETPLQDDLREFLDREKIDIEIVTSLSCDIKIARCDEHIESGPDTIYSGGWIACETARSMAKKLEISFSQMGKLLNHLEVKIRKCGLGCFK